MTSNSFNAGRFHRWILHITMLAIPLTARPAESPVQCQQTDEAIVVTLRGAHVLTYHKKEHAAEGIEPIYARSGFIHPLTTPGGRVVTDGFPKPHHAHQHGVFQAWTKCRFDGRKIDFWNQAKGSGRIRHDQVLSIKTQPDHAEFKVRLVHSDLKAPGGEVPVLFETWTVRIPAGKPGDPHVIDIASEQICAGEKPLTHDKYHYGGMAIRGSAQWVNLADEEAKRKGNTTKTKPGCSMLTSEGKNQRNGNHSQPNWVAIYGQVDETIAGAALLSHSGNFRHPQPVRLHPSMPYFCFAPMVNDAFTIEPGKPMTSRYRVVAYDGKPDAQHLDGLWSAFCTPVNEPTKKRQ